MDKQPNEVNDILSHDYVGKCDMCGVCCIGVSINSKLPDGSTFNKPSGVSCKYLKDNKCSVWGDVERQPEVCRSIKPTNSLCRFDLRSKLDGRKRHLLWLMKLDKMTRKAGGPMQIKLSKQQWQSIGKQAGWMVGMEKTACIKKIASITFKVSGSDKVAQPLGMSDLGWDMLHFWENKNPIGASVSDHYNPPQIVMDGCRNMDSPTGILNFYYGSIFDRSNGRRLTPLDIQKFIEAYMQHNSAIKMRIVNADDDSQMYEGMKVARIQVYENKTFEYERVPEFNAANSNAYALLALLRDNGLPIEKGVCYGSFSVEDLKRAISNIENKPKGVGDYSRETVDNKADRPDDASGIHIIENGLSSERLWEYLGMLQEMIDYIEGHGLSVNIVFG